MTEPVVAPVVTTVVDPVTATVVAPPWHGITDPDAAAYVANKGWTNPAEVVKSYQGAEKLIGRDPNTLLVMPRADDPAGFRAVMAKLGLPETADKYEFDTPAGVTPDAGYVAFAKGAFHKIGLTAAQAKDLTREHNAYVGGVLAEQENTYNLAVDTDKKALLAEWKGGHERMMNAAQTAAKTLGFEQPTIDAMEKSIGYAKTMKFFAELGKKMGEDGFVTGGDKGRAFGVSLTPAEAKADWETLKSDPVVAKALFDTTHPGHANAVAKQKALFALMYPT